MKILFTNTKPATAYKWFAETFKNNLPRALDDACLHFFNAYSTLKTSDTGIIEDYVNENPTDNFLDVLLFAI